ncbi:CBS domain-containing protein [Streptomyces sioyaensis]|uniref:CBS domain-containing protein n=1 Tax=Streptomyces sioyaensis TaxID=67364 RepID=UPI0037CF56C3
MLIKDLMTSPPAGVPQDATLEEAARHMARARVGGALPVVEADHLADFLGTSQVTLWAR